MANIQPRRNKDGKVISYSIRVYKGRDFISRKQLKPYTMTWKAPSGWSEKTAEKEALKQAAIFEKQCKDGTQTDSRLTFSEYADYVIKTRFRAGVLKQKTKHHYRELLIRTDDAIGHMKLKDIRPVHINKFYEQLSCAKARRCGEKAIAKINLSALISERGLSKLGISKKENVSIHYNTVHRACKGAKIAASSATEISKALDMPAKKIFDFMSDDTPLSWRTIRDHHLFISTVMAQAEREMLIPYNPASKAIPPKAHEYSPNYLQIDDVRQIIEALKAEHIKWQAMIHLFLVTGARMSEIIGLKWQCVDRESRQIRIDRALLYTSETGLYEDTPKTKNSVRTISIPDETVGLLGEYCTWQAGQKLMLGDKWKNCEYIFTNKHGGGLNPGTVGNWLRSFSKRHGLPHLNAHAFRHTLASILFVSGADAVSISKRLGHSRVSTTTDIYSHSMRESETRVSKCIADVIYGG